MTERPTYKCKNVIESLLRKKKEALSKEDIIEILNICDNIRLRTYLIWHIITRKGLNLYLLCYKLAETLPSMPISKRA